ncbi:MAG: ABC transporter ATP-binding protein, partial [Clostridiales bacterium]|nr:ABC transporter ATP-binding protein [Clostridiales bacterium]
MRDFLRILSFIRKGRVSYIAGLLVCSITGAAASLMTAFVVKNLLDAAIQKDSARLITAIVMIAGIALGLCILLPVFNYIFKSVVHRTMADIRLRVVEHLEAMKIDYYEETHSGEIVSRVNNDIQAMEAAFSSNLVVLLSTILTGISSAVLMFIFDWRTASILIMLGIISAFA